MDMLTFEQYKAQRDQYQKWIDEIGAELRAYPKNEMGMTIESIRMSPAYKEKKNLFRICHIERINVNGCARSHLPDYISGICKDLHLDSQLLDAYTLV